MDIKPYKYMALYIALIVIFWYYNKGNKREVE